MKASVFSIDGKAAGEKELPKQFDEEYRPDLIRRAYHAERTILLQPKGCYPLAGMQNTAEYYGRRHAWRQTINTGRSHLPREKIPGGKSGRVLTVPHAVKGRRAHPPKPFTRLRERINLKEKNMAIRSAMHATMDVELVKARGHKFSGKLPVVIDDAFEGVKRVKEAKKILETLGFGEDLKRAHDGRQMRSGRARLRKGGYVEPKSLLVVYGDDKGVWKACRNIPGVDCTNVKDLTAELLAPGGSAGRLTIWTVDALGKLANDGLFV